jgi:hypothetical protein
VLGENCHGKLEISSNPIIRATHATVELCCNQCKGVCCADSASGEVTTFKTEKHKEGMSPHVLRDVVASALSCQSYESYQISKLILGESAVAPTTYQHALSLLWKAADEKNG